jgi:hypothetical protein
MSNRVQVRISTAAERAGKTEKFWSLTVSDEMTPNFERLPDADLKSYSLSAKDWAVVKKKAESLGATWKTAKFSSGAAKGQNYFTTKPQVVVLEIELTKSLKDSVRDLDRKTTSLSISGQVKKITVREQRAGNSIDLED